ncbi:MAG: PilZ domain-containing protein [Candidatus Omnitrophica bacterium]|nr:PilZ domain-containing protein [Candidatus Omnitrophota bacterium]
MARLSLRERRRRQRVDIALPIRIKYSRKEISGRTKNISVLGTYLEADKEIPIGTTLDIKIRIPETGQRQAGKSREIRCAGIAFRSHPSGSLEPKSQYGIGIFFRSFSERGEKNLSKYIDYTLSEEKKMGKIYMRKRKKEQRQSKRKGGEQ